MCSLVPLLFPSSVQEEKSRKGAAEPDHKEEEWEEGDQDWDGQEWNKGQETPQEWQAPHGQECEAPHEQEWEAPHGQECEAPHEQEWEAPHGQEWQAPHGQEWEAPHGQWEAPHGQEGDALHASHELESESGTWEEGDKGEEAPQKQLCGEELEDASDWDEEGNWIGEPAIPTPTSGKTEWYESGHWDPDQNAPMPPEMLTEDWDVDGGLMQRAGEFVTSACAGPWLA